MPELLCVGQIDNAASPSAAAGKLYLKTSTQFGASAGANDVAMIYESQDFAPCGPTGRCVARRLYVTVEYSGSVVLRVTPIVDFETSLAPVQKSLAPPLGGRKRTIIEVPFAKPCTYVRCKVEVLSRSGLVWLHGVRLAHRPLSQAYEQIAGTDG